MHKPKKEITEKQKAARVANLAAGRSKRMEQINKKKAEPVSPPDNEYDLDSHDNSSMESDDSEDFVLKENQ